MLYPLPNTFALLNNYVMKIILAVRKSNMMEISSPGMLPVPALLITSPRQ